MNLIQNVAPADPSDAFIKVVCDHLRRRAIISEDSPPEAVWPADIDYIRHCTKAAIATLDGPKSTIRRALFDQEWSLYLDAFPAVIELPLSPLQGVVFIKYRDASGAWQTMDADDYRASATHSWQPEISPASGTWWPETSGDRECIEVCFDAGFGDDHADVPNAILQAILELAAHFYTERQPVVFGSPYELPFGVKSLLSPYRVFR